MCLDRNKSAHRTSAYKMDKLILRRGQPFYMNVKFARDYKPHEDKISVELRMGKSL